MFCTSCGNDIEDGSTVCSKCGVAVNAPKPATENVSSPLCLAILVTIFCCWPFGIPAIVNVARVNARLASGDIDGAKAAASSAKTWILVSFILGLVGGLIYIIAVAASM